MFLFLIAPHFLCDCEKPPCGTVVNQFAFSADCSRIPAKAKLHFSRGGHKGGICCTCDISADTAEPTAT